MYLYFYNYNNYYNRKVKYENSINGYNTASTRSYSFPSPVSFNLNDGANTEFVVTGMDNFKYDYLVCSEDGSTIHSRWFVIEAKRERTGTYTLTLHRDVIAEDYTKIIKAPMFIEKAIVGPSDPAIFNNEDMTFNQIKTSETLLKDETGCAWIVGYIASFDSENQQEIEYTADTLATGEFDLAVNGIENWQYYNNLNTNYLDEDVSFDFRTKVVYAVGITQNVIMEIINSITHGVSQGTAEMGASLVSGAYRSSIQAHGSVQDNLYSSVMDSNLESLSNLAKNFITYNPGLCTTLLGLSGKVIKDTSTNKFYRIVTTRQNYTNSQRITAGNLYNTWNNILLNSNQYTNTGNGWLTLKTMGSSVLMALEEITTNASSITMQTSRNHLNDNPYDMFCIPFSDSLVVKVNGVSKFTASKQQAYLIATAIARKYGATALYDLQLLPYCPVREHIQANGDFNILSDENKSISYLQHQVGQETIIDGGVIWTRSSSFTFNINHSIIPEDYKISNLTEMYRLCSPNYAGVFEFSAAKNGGVNYINVDCTYKPYTPYIHINPDFNRLYGSDFNDARGLICGGDYSLPIITSAWETYQLQNKNYQASFDRQIQNLEIKQNVERLQDIVGGITGALGAGVGAGMVFGPIAAGVGGVLSAAAGVGDYAINEMLRNETIDYTKDQFGYQLGNIKALPDALAKVSAFTSNNKIFPFIEYYTCTEKEKQALIDKIKYNGMSIGRIGKIEEFLQTDTSYIKGLLIRIEDIDEDYHYIKTIADELNKGVFI